MADPRALLRPVNIQSHQFFARGLFHRFTDTHAIIEDMDGAVGMYKLEQYSIKFTDIKESNSDG